MAARFTELIVDAHDPEQLAKFWAAVLGWRTTTQHDGLVEIASDDRVVPTLVFVPVPDAKTTKNRLHIDVNPVGCEQDDELARLLALGAVQVDVGQGDDAPWVVLADPEGNEFCLLRSRVG